MISSDYLIQEYQDLIESLSKPLECTVEQIQEWEPGT